MMINKNNNDVKQFLDEEGMEGNNSKRKMVLYPLQQDWMIKAFLPNFSYNKIPSTDLVVKPIDSDL